MHPNTLHPVCPLTRFVKERRPSISPNFNFLGQLQLFQGTLSQTASGGGGDLLLQQLDSCLPSIIDSVRHHHASQKVNCEAESAGHTDGTQQSHTHSDGNGNQQRSRSGKRLTLHLTLNQNQQEVRTSREALAPSPHRQVKPVPKPMQLQLPSDSASLLEKRKSLTLSLTPLESSSPATESGSQRARGATSSKTVHDGETGGRKEAKTQRSPVSYKQAEVHEQGPLSPFSLTLNKLLGWGERVLLGGVSVHPALPYRGWRCRVWGCLCLCMVVERNHIAYVMYRKSVKSELFYLPLYLFIYYRAENENLTLTSNLHICTRCITTDTDQQFFLFVRCNYFERPVFTDDLISDISTVSYSTCITISSVHTCFFPSIWWSLLIFWWCSQINWCFWNIEKCKKYIFRFTMKL